MSVTDPESVASPSEGQESSVRRTGKAPAHATGVSDDAISVGDLTEGGRGSGESEAVGEDERQGQPRLGKESELRERLDRALDRVEYLQQYLDQQRGQSSYWRGMYRIMVRILAEQHDDPALAWLDEIVHDRFAHLLSERKL